ncbi:hypothetical protein NEICINOT_04224 [Neisseria cinerea ATCC 14685]|uniref:Uncharacterized protein n=1 Tax=Neisseria cinerea ATCC 14685 TaxID=546262 RepID=D0W3I3_NEICI|nr:hypothetical protein NEICINOT_04224 [Neisseria cinerea ATCC 14685]
MFGFSRFFLGGFRRHQYGLKYGNIVINPQMKYKFSNAGRFIVFVSLKMKRIKHK